MERNELRVDTSSSNQAGRLHTFARVSRTTVQDVSRSDKSNPVHISDSVSEAATREVRPAPGRFAVGSESNVPPMRGGGYRLHRVVALVVLLLAGGIVCGTWLLGWLSDQELSHPRLPSEPDLRLVAPEPNEPREGSFEQATSANLPEETSSRAEQEMLERGLGVLRREAQELQDVLESRQSELAEIEAKLAERRADLERLNPLPSVSRLNPTAEGDVATGTPERAIPFPRRRPDLEP
jgi:hypothetical protein